MTATDVGREHTDAGGEQDARFHFPGVLGWVASASVLAVGVVWRDPEAIVFAVACGVAATAVALRRLRRLAGVGLFLLLADLLFWMAPAALSTARHGDRASVVAVTTWLSGLALGGIVALGASLGRRRLRWSETTVRAASGGLLAAVILLLLIGALLAPVFRPTAGSPRSRAAQAAGSSTAIEAKAVRFSAERLVMAEGVVSITVRNRDLFWHTFTVPGHGEVRVPTGSTRTLIIDLRAGDYPFLCAIPGHDTQMAGTIEVR